MMAVLNKKLIQQQLSLSDYYIVRQNDTNLRNRLGERDAHIAKCHKMLTNVRSIAYDREREVRNLKSKNKKMLQSLRYVDSLFLECFCSDEIKKKDEIISDLKKSQQMDRNKILLLDNFLFDNDIDLKMMSPASIQMFRPRVTRQTR